MNQPHTDSCETILLSPGHPLPSTSALLPYSVTDAIVAERDAAIEALQNARDATLQAVTAIRDARDTFDTASADHGSFSVVLSGNGRSNTLLSADATEDADYFENQIRCAVDAAVWKRIIHTTRLRQLMDSTAKQELRKQLDTNPPEVTRDNIHATINAMVANSGEIFRRGIAACFSSLDRRFRSHDGFSIGARIILSDAFDQYGTWNYSGKQRDTLIDVERTMRILDGKPAELSNDETDVIHAIDAKRKHWRLKPSPCTVETPYIRIKIFGNGNCHLWFTRPDLVLDVNRQLADYYGMTLGDQTDQVQTNARRAAASSRANLPVARNNGFFPTPDDVADRIIHSARLPASGATVLEPSAGTGSIAARAAQAGATVDCIELQQHLAEELRATNLYREVRHADFLQVPPARTYDFILMNPPFDRGLDINHVEHALEFLNPDGLLVAIMSAGTEFRTTIQAELFRHNINTLKGQWIDLPPGSFSSVGTNVNTLVVAVNKNGRSPRIWL